MKPVAHIPHSTDKPGHGTIIGVIIIMSSLLLWCSCFAPKVIQDELQSENAIMFRSFNIDKAMCYCLNQYYPNEIVINVIDSIVSKGFSCDTTYDKALGYAISVYLDSADIETLTFEQIRMLDVWYSQIKGIFMYYDHPILISGNLSNEMFLQTGKDTCLIGIKPEFLIQKHFLATCPQWTFKYNKHNNTLEGPY
jgi:hypothetical protein